MQAASSVSGYSNHQRNYHSRNHGQRNGKRRIIPSTPWNPYTKSFCPPCTRNTMPTITRRTVIPHVCWLAPLLIRSPFAPGPSSRNWPASTAQRFGFPIFLPAAAIPLDVFFALRLSKVHSNQAGDEALDLCILFQRAPHLIN
jgi:hypothetical protein